MIDDYRDVTYLPTIGEALNIKTRKQGRRIPVVNQIDAKDFSKKGNIRSLGARSYRNNTVAILKNNCKRILLSTHASLKQKECARDLEGRINSLDPSEQFKIKEFQWLVKAVNGITRTLSRTYKDF